MSHKTHLPAESNKPMSTSTSTAMPGLGIDWDFYMEMLETSDATDEEKRELVQTLWNIIVAFVDLGFGVHPIQQACEQNEIFAQISTLDFPEVIDSEHSSKSAFGQSADPTKEPRKAGSKT